MQKIAKIILGILFVTVVVALIITIIIASESILEQIGGNDPPNISTLLAEITVGIIISGLIYALSTQQSEKIKKQTKDIEQLLKDTKDQQNKISELLNEFKNLQDKRFVQYFHQKAMILNTVEQELNKIMTAYDEKKFPYILNRIERIMPSLDNHENYLNMVYGDIRSDSGELNWLSSLRFAISHIPTQLEPDQGESITNIFKTIESIINSGKKKLPENEKENKSGFYIG